MWADCAGPYARASAGGNARASKVGRPACRNEAQAFCCIGTQPPDSRCFWCTRAGRSGQIATRARGPSRRANTQAGEAALDAARREFAEETGFGLDGEAVALGSFRQSRAKTVDVWAVQGDADPAKLVSNTFVMEWPPRSGRTQEFPEVDRAGWFALPEAACKLVKGQVAILEALDRCVRRRR